jgi:hypothetical protein
MSLTVIVSDGPIFSAVRKYWEEKTTKGDESPYGIPTWRNGQLVISLAVSWYGWRK